MTLLEKIKALYPELQGSDFYPIEGSIRLQDDGEGAFISEWNHPTLPRPTEEQLAANEQEQLA